MASISKAFGLAALSGILFGASLPPYHVPFLGWIALAPLFFGVMGQGAIVGFLGGLVAALLPAMLLAVGLAAAPIPMYGEPNWIVGGYGLFGILLSIMGAMVGDGKPIGLKKALTYAAWGVLLECGTTSILPENIALTQSRFLPALWLASIGGIWAVSFCVWAFNLAVAGSLGNRRRLLALAVGWCLCAAVGGLAFRRVDVKPNDLKVAIVQNDTTDLDELYGFNQDASEKGAAVAVWPELSGLTSAPMGKTDALKKLTLERDQVPFVSTFEDDAAPLPHNAAALFADGKESERYWKRRPFAGERMKHAAGSRAVVVPFEVPIGLNICFDSCYPSVMRDTARLGAYFIALPTQDPPSRDGVVQSIHAAYTPFRAAELGVSIARADITADSMVVGPDGRILRELGGGEDEAVVGIPPPHTTLYRRFGDWFPVGCSIAIAGVWVRRRWRRR